MISAITVLFKPSPEVYINIQTYLDKVACLYVVDNSPSLSKTSERLLKEKKIKLLSSSVNVGISEAYNLGLYRAEQDGYRWLMTMDQDSFFEPYQIEHFFEDFKKAQKNNLGIYAPLHNPKFLSQEEDKQVLAVMSSASIVNVDMALGMGGFDTALFIDEVDHEFCMRMQEKDFIVLQNCRAFLNHSLGGKGERDRKKYSATRLYYMMRNHLYIKKKYQNLYPDYFEKRKSYIRSFLAEQVMHHNHKLHRSAMIFAGIKDYFLKRMGKRYEF